MAESHAIYRTQQMPMGRTCGYIVCMTYIGFRIGSLCFIEAMREAVGCYIAFEP